MSPERTDDAWEELGVPHRDVEGWQQMGFGPFEAALAHGDGYTVLNSVHSRHQLLKTAAAWRRAGLDNAEGLRWHRAGFGAEEAATFRREHVTLETARARLRS